jgi:hypothetical protein
VEGGRAGGEAAADRAGGRGDGGGVREEEEGDKREMKSKWAFMG